MRYCLRHGTNFEGYDLLGETNNYCKSRKIIECCGQELICEHFTNTCRNCGSDFNMSGDQLADRSQWGSETGESVSDILSVDINQSDDNWED